MSYSEENGQVVLRMSREDYERLLKVGYYVAAHWDVREFLNRLNAGNPNYRPYEVAERK